MKPKPTNIDEFMRAGETAAAETPSHTKPASQPAPTPAAKPEQRIVKSIRVAHSIDLAIKRLAFEDTQAQGRRVTESDLIEFALRQFLESRDVEI
ncbi:hypothetical protein [Dyella sp.]|uniref:hypothetical protein n=1 Tax=Dyella sp. TaxID=1869338 RepID=UPI002ED59C8F